MSGNPQTATAQKTGIRLNTTLLTENEGLVARFATKQRMTKVGTVTFFGVPVTAYETSYVDRYGVMRVQLHLCIGREGTEEFLKADMAVRAKQMAASDDNPSIGYFASSDPKILLENYKVLWTSMNALRNTWVPTGGTRGKWDNKSTNGIEIKFPEREGEVYYVLADRCKNHLEIMRRKTADEYDAEAPAESMNVGDADTTITLPDF